MVVVFRIRNKGNRLLAINATLDDTIYMNHADSRTCGSNGGYSNVEGSIFLASLIMASVNLGLCTAVTKDILYICT